MEENKGSVSYLALEGVMTHFSIIIKRLVIVLITVLLLWAATIAGFIWYISLPVEEYTEISVENDEGNANYVGNDMIGDINYGESEKN